VFVQGCSFNCIACHNPATISRRVHAEQVTVEDLLARIEPVAPYLAGVTVSGGEATTQPLFVRDLFTAVHTGLPALTCFVDSNGHAPQRTWDLLLPGLDGAMIDLKALDPDVHRFLTGEPNDRVLDSIRYLHERERLHEVRLLIIPGRNDTPAQLAATAEWLATLDPDLRTVVIGFRRHGVRRPGRSLREATPDDLAAAEATLRAGGLQQVVTV
jgi:pyruvate formate lyase activating enzyme